MKTRIGWLVYDKSGANRNKEYIKMHYEEANKLGVEILLKYAEELTVGISQNELVLYEKGKRVESGCYPDFVICRTIQPELTQYLEMCKLKVFNNSFVSRVCNDKAATYAYLAGKNIPLIESAFVKNSVLKECMDHIPQGVIIKAVDGHGGEQVFLWKKDQDKKEMLEKIGNSNVIIQQFTGKARQDVRVYVIGNRIVGAIKRTAKEGFRSNYSLGGKIEEYSLTNEQKQLVEKVIKEFEFGLVGIDFIIGEKGEFILNEIEDVVGARMLYQCTDINLVKEYLIFILEKMKTV